MLRLLKLLKLLKILRVLRVSRLFTRWEDRLQSSYTKARVSSIPEMCGYLI
jgi:hypothetical protein